MKKIRLVVVVILVSGLGSCSKYLDVVPDNVATLESAFTLRATALRYLATCYSYMPPAMNYSYDPAVGFWGGETWSVYPYYNPYTFLYARGDLGVVNPYFSYWDGTGNGTPLFSGIRDCNIFLENINNVQDLDDQERARWVAEAKFLKAYYHFYLLRQYGPIPLIRENLEISAGVEEVKRFREPVDECFAYIMELLDEAIPDLPLMILDSENELGRITAPAAASIKAKILVTAASPFFNGNTDYAGFIDKRGTQLFNQVYEAAKWDTALEACESALLLCDEAGLELYVFSPGPGEVVSDATRYQMSVRNTVALKWNEETIWGWANDNQDQSTLTPISWDPSKSGLLLVTDHYGPSLEYTDIFHTANGVPIDEDLTWDYEGRYGLRTAVAAERYNISEGYTTAKLNFDRENRFYACLGFDGGVWYGQGRYNDNDPWVLYGKFGQAAGKQFAGYHTPTGYWHKKVINYRNVVNTNSYSAVWYPTPMMRLADLYLLYAEALNEVSGPSETAYEFLNRVRTRAGLLSVQDAWTQFSSDPDKFKRKDGLREIIHREREIELAFEGHRYWDMRRWKRAETEFSKPVSGWNLEGSTTQAYYNKVRVEPDFNQTFEKRNYLDPIREHAIITNENLLQNPGW